VKRSVTKQVRFLFHSCRSGSAGNLSDLQFDAPLRELLKPDGGMGSKADTIVQVLQLVFLGILAYLIVRALNAMVFGLVRFRRGFEAPTLVRNIFSISPSPLFFLIFTSIFPDANLGALFNNVRDLRRDPGSCAAGHAGEFLCGDLAASGPALSGGDVITVGASDILVWLKK